MRVINLALHLGRMEKEREKERWREREREPVRNIKFVQ